MLKKTLQDTIASANFLSRKKQDTSAMIEMSGRDLTARLPDDTYLERLSVVDEKNKIDMQGLSDNTSKLIEALQKSEVLENPSFQGTIQQDPRTKKDRFNLTADFRKKGDAPAPKDPASREQNPRGHGAVDQGKTDPGTHKERGRNEGGLGNAPAPRSP